MAIPLPQRPKILSILFIHVGFGSPSPSMGEGWGEGGPPPFVLSLSKDPPSRRGTQRRGNPVAPARILSLWKAPPLSDYPMAAGNRKSTGSGKIASKKICREGSYDGR